ncbi:BRO family protein [Bacillus mycoides]|uniref:Bro-N domain-containing protein n=1 Tax=Bacillus mycoides TaxID=1405 RepID=A0A1S9TCN9_BACMY|nr:BRO family protein [Bacillus mycoides]OOR07786.1 hypothetical protein BW900_04545 [Bacillus mycoides]
MSNVQLFDGALGQVRTVTQGEEIWFVAKDVCDILEITNQGNAVSRLDEDEKGDVGLTDAIGRTQSTSIINESGLYSLVITSRKPQAKVFKKWITSDVIPTIRKTGGYVQEDREEEFIHKYLPSLFEDTKKAMVLDLRAQNLEMKKTIEVIENKVERDSLVERAEVLERVKNLLLLPDLEMATTQ